MTYAVQKLCCMLMQGHDSVLTKTALAAPELSYLRAQLC
jgi:hypothetical protein